MGKHSGKGKGGLGSAGKHGGKGKVSGKVAGAKGKGKSGGKGLKGTKVAGAKGQKGKAGAKGAGKGKQGGKLAKGGAGKGQLGASKRSAQDLTPKQIQQLAANFNKFNPAQQKAVLDLLQGKATPGDLKAIQGLLNNPNVSNGVKDALLTALIPGGNGGNGLLGGLAGLLGGGGGGGLGGGGGMMGGDGGMMGGGDGGYPIPGPGGDGDGGGYPIPGPGGAGGVVLPTPVDGGDGPVVAAGDGGDADDGEEAADDSAPASEVQQLRRLLQVKNSTGEKVRLWVQYRTLNSDGSWDWYPSAPGGDDAVAFELEPGEETYLEDDDWTLKAARVRIWAESDSGNEWLDYKDDDLWLVEEQPDGYRYYYADDMETFTFTIE